MASAAERRLRAVPERETLLAKIAREAREDRRRDPQAWITQRALEVRNTVEPGERR